MSMDAGPRIVVRQRRMPRLLRGVFFVLAILFLLAPAELYLRWFPPADMHPYLGEEAPISGVFAPDRDFAITYASWPALCGANPELQPYLDLADWSRQKPAWAFFGNSFVQAPGMLADTVRARVPEKAVFNLGKNELLPVRCAQAKMLLDHGLAPERLFVALMPVDLIGLGSQPLSSMHVTQRGALTYVPRRPGGVLDDVVANSRLALTAWCRTGLQKGKPLFTRSSLLRQLDDELVDDVARLFGGLARAAQQHDVPVTVLLIPSHDHVCRGVPCTFQDTLAPRFRALGLDVFDPRDAFCQHPRKRELFIPDLHFNDAGNQLLLRELQAHLQRLAIMKPGPS